MSPIEAHIIGFQVMYWPVFRNKLDILLCYGGAQMEPQKVCPIRLASDPINIYKYVRSLPPDIDIISTTNEFLENSIRQPPTISTHPVTILQKLFLTYRFLVW